MKRMIPQSLIAWVKSLFHRVAPGEGEGDIQIGGNLEVDGYYYPSIKLAGYAGASYGFEISPSATGSMDVLEFRATVQPNRLKPRILSGNKYSKIWTSPDSAGYFCNAQLISLLATEDENMWSGVGVIHNDASGMSHSALDMGFAHQYTGYNTGNNYLILKDRLEVKKSDQYLYNISTPTALKSSEELTTTPAGTATLVSERLEKEELYIGGHNTIHISLTAALTNATSGQIAFTGTNLNTNQAFTGVLLKGDTLIGVCYLKITSATKATLYYQNPLGVALEAGDYTANLSLIAAN